MKLRAVNKHEMVPYCTFTMSGHGVSLTGTIPRIRRRREHSSQRADGSLPEMLVAFGGSEAQAPWRIFNVSSLDSTCNSCKGQDGSTPFGLCDDRFKDRRCPLSASA